MEQSFLFLILLVLPTIFAQSDSSDQCISKDRACSNECLKLGYIQNQDDNSCDYPPIEFCLDQNQPNCSEEKSACRTQYGFQRYYDSGKCVPSTYTCISQDRACSHRCSKLGFQNKDGNSCGYPSIKFCLDQTQSNCSEVKSACRIYGFKKDDQSGICIANTNCLTTEVSNLCQPWKYCNQYLGYEKAYYGDCRIPVDCTTGNQCENHKTACVDAGFSKNSYDNECICQSPLKEIVLLEIDDGDEKSSKICKPCQSDSNICSAVCIEQGWVSFENKCVVPNCLALNDACDGKKLCSVVQGYVAKSESDKTCMIPAQCEEVGKKNCSTPSFVCSSMQGFTKKPDSEDCECDSKKIIKDNKCVDITVEQSVEQTDQKTIENTVQRTCKRDTDKCTEECIANGWVNSENKCVEPDCLAVNDACDGKKLCSVVYGYVAKSESDKTCMIPAQCEEVGKKNCSTPSFVCSSMQGFTKKPDSEDCECKSKKDMSDNNKCTDKTSSIKLLFSLVSLLLLILA